MTMTSFPSESGPYLYFESSRLVLRGAPLWSIFIGLVALFFLGAIFAGGAGLKDKINQWRSVIPHFLGLWLPLVASITLLYLFVAVGLMDKYALYPATTKDPETLSPHWPAVILFLAGLVVFYWLGRRLARSLGEKLPAPQPGAIKSFALFIVGLAAVFVLATNPFSLLFFIPLLFWLLIGVRKGAGRWLDILFLISGGAIVYFLIYMLGFVILQMGFAVFWYIMLMFSIGMVGFLTVLAVTAVLAAGLTMVVRSPVWTV